MPSETAFKSSSAPASLSDSRLTERIIRTSDDLATVHDVRERAMLFEAIGDRPSAAEGADPSNSPTAKCRNLMLLPLLSL